ncbi:MAG: PAS domain-containing protein [Chloroflexi bacterium]|nr:PAS domain-containing protein [Chloroflexota bacterium]
MQESDPGNPAPGPAGDAGRAADLARARNEALRERAFADSVAALIIERRLDESAARYNRRWLEYTGLTAEESEARGWRQVVHPDDLALLPDPAAVRDRREPWEGEIRLRRHDGEYRWHRARFVPAIGGEGQLLGWVSSGLDIHDRTVAEREREAALARLQAITTALPSIVVEVLPGGHIATCNDAYREYFGLKPDELPGQLWIEFVHPEDRAMLASAIASLSEAPTQSEIRLRRHDGEYRWHIARAIVRRDAGGAAASYVATATDIHARKLAEEAVRLSEGRYRTLIEALPQLVFVANERGEAVFVNRRWCDYTGLGPEQSYGRAWLSAIHVADARNGSEALRAAIASGATFTDTLRFRRADGAFRWHLAQAVPMQSFEGAVINWFVTATDIHEQRLAADREQLRAELGRALTASLDPQETLESIARVAVPAIADRCCIDIVGPDGHLSRAVAFGEPAATVTGAKEAEAIAAVVRTGETRMGGAPGRGVGAHSFVTVPMRQGDATLGAITFSLAPAAKGFSLDARALAEEIASRAALAVANARLFAERVRTAEALRTSDARYRALIDAVPQIVWVTGIDGVADFYNRRWEEVTGLDPTDLEAWAGVIHPDDIDRVNETWGTAFAGQQTWECEYRLRMRGGEYRWYLGRASPLPDGTLTPRWLGAATEIEAIKHAQEALQRANVLKDEFLGLVSHELRTPLTSILGHASLLTRHGAILDEGSRLSSLRDITREAERLQRLVENMLVLAGVEGRGEVVTEPLLAQRLVARVVTNHNVRYPGRELRVSIASGLSPVDAQPTYFDQVLENLLSNSEKYSPAGEPIEITVTEEGGYVIVRVLDRGAGIPEQETSHIFEPFFRSERTARAAPGAGLGLAVCRRLVEAQGGSIWAALRPGGGTEFGFALPAVTEE